MKKIDFSSQEQVMSKTLLGDFFKEVTDCDSECYEVKGILFTKNNETEKESWNIEAEVYDNGDQWTPPSRDYINIANPCSSLLGAIVAAAKTIEIQRIDDIAQAVSEEWLHKKDIFNDFEIE